MTPDMNLSLAQTLPMLSNSKQNPSTPDDSGRALLTTGGTFSKDSKPVTADTISISSQSRQATSELKKEEAKILKKSSINPDTPSAKIQFVYDLKGELITKYMDSTNRIIYQNPSKLMLKLRETDSKSDSSVDMRA